MERNYATLYIHCLLGQIPAQLLEKSRMSQTNLATIYNHGSSVVNKRGRSVECGAFLYATQNVNTLWTVDSIHTA